MGYLSFGFDDLLGAIRVFEEALETERGATEKRQKARLAEAVKPDSNIPFFMLKAVDEWRVETAFPTIMRRSLFITIYSLVEHYLNDYCRAVRKEKKLGLSFRDVKGEGIERAKLYCTKAAGIAFPSSTEEWSRLMEYNRIRNALAHNNGQVRGDSKKKMEEIASRRKFFTVTSEGEIHLAKAFCEEAVEVTGKFFQQLSTVYWPTAPGDPDG